MSNHIQMYIVLIIQVLFAVFTDSQVTNTDHEPLIDQEINWLDWEEAAALQAENPKKIFVDVYTDWCGYCKKMDRTTFADPEIISYLNEHFYSIKLDAEMKETVVFRDVEFEYRQTGRRGIHTLAYSLCEGKMSFQTYVTMNENYDRIAISPGYKTTPMLMKELIFAAEEKYKEMSWAEFSKAK